METVTVLVIEYDEEVLSYVREVLEEEGLTVVTSRGARDGFFHLETERPDLVISTFSLPEEERFKLLEWSRSGTDHAGDVPVVFMATEDSPRLERRWMKAGASGFLKKPFLPEDLTQMIWGLLGRGR